jgi:hypothetical protein
MRGELVWRNWPHFQRNRHVNETNYSLFGYKEGRTVKGTNFVDLRDAVDPVELGALYAQEGADELVF